MNIGYVRVSTGDQSTARQLDGIPLDIVYEDKISGATKDRPKLNECLIALRKGDTLHVHSIDRLARSQRHLLELLEGMISRGITIHFHKESLIFNGNGDSPISMLLLQVIGAVAQFERTSMLERVQEGIAMTKIHGTRSGKPFGKPPLDMTRRTEAIDYCKQGMNITEVSRAMGLSRSSIYKLLA